LLQKRFGVFYSPFYLFGSFPKCIGDAVFISSHFKHFMVSADGIFIQSDTISNIIDNVIITPYREIFFYVLDVLLY